MKSKGEVFQHFQCFYIKPKEPWNDTTKHHPIAKLVERWTMRQFLHKNLQLYLSSSFSFSSPTDYFQGTRSLELLSRELPHFSFYNQHISLSACYCYSKQFVCIKLLTKCSSFSTIVKLLRKLLTTLQTTKAGKFLVISPVSVVKHITSKDWSPEWNNKIDTTSTHSKQNKTYAKAVYSPTWNR